MSDLVKQLRDYINFVDDIELRRIAANQLEQLEAKVVTQQVRIEQLKEVLWDTNKYLDQTYADLIGNLGAEWLAARIVDKLSPALSSALSTPDDLSALRAHDAAIWREAMQIAEDSRDKATMSKYSSVPECRAARDMAECLSKAYCHKADAIEKGGDK